MHGQRIAKMNNLRKNQQRGAALYIVVILVLLSMLVALWASRSAIFNELVAGNDADYQRAMESAQSMVQDAQDDIYRHLYDSTKTSLRTGGAQQFPGSQDMFFSSWSDNLSAQTNQCKDAICLRRTTAEDFWNDPSTLQVMLGLGARYGQFSGAKQSGSSTITPPNPILAFTDANKGAWYWIEPMPYGTPGLSPGGNTGKIVQGAATPATNAEMIFRVTALAFGIKGSSSSKDFSEHSPTMAVIQTVISMPAIRGE